MLIPALAFFAGKTLSDMGVFGGAKSNAPQHHAPPLDPYATICPVDAHMSLEDRDSCRNAWAKATAAELMGIATAIQAQYPVAAGTLFHKAAVLATSPKTPAVVPQQTPAEPTPIRKTYSPTVTTPANGKASVIVDAPPVAAKDVPEDIGIQ
jgi:hypothetical protein